MRIIPAGTFVCDAATAKDPAALKAAGYVGIARYITGNVNDWRQLSIRERDAYAAAGLGVWLIWETQANAALGGAPKGTLHGAAARRDADRLGYTGTVVIATTDFDVTASTLDAVLAYCRAFQRACGLPCGIYGDTNIAAGVRPGEFALIWRPSASWWSRVFAFGKWFNTYVHPNTDIRQFGARGVPGTDHGVVLRDVPMWTYLAPVVAPLKPIVVPKPTLQKTLTSPFKVSEEVRNLQSVCNFWGAAQPQGKRFSAGPADGKFGNQTGAGVEAFQRLLGVKPDRIYGPATATAYTGFLRWLQHG